jgi:hypothetical protein
VNVCASIALTALLFQYSQMKSRFHYLLLVRCDWEIHCHLCGIALRKVKAEAILCVLCAPVSIFGTHVAQNLWWPSLTMIISYRIVSEICKNSQESSEIVKRCLSQTFWSTIWTRSSLTTNTGHFALHREHLFARLWTIYTTVLQFLHSLHFGGFTTDSTTLMFLSWSKRIARISQLAG